MSPLSHYKIYGLTIASELLLPQLLPAEGQLSADIIVRYGAIPEFLDNPVDGGPTWQVTQNEFLFTVLGVGRYWARNGKEIWIERDPKADDADVWTFLLGTTLGVVLHQRQIWALHASAIQTDRGAVLFTGMSGAGKSTTLNGMLGRGYPMVADDVSGIVVDEQGQPQVLSAFPHSRLWAETAQQLALSTDGVPRVRPSLDKYLFPVDNFVEGPVPLHTVYLLYPYNQSELQLQEMEQANKFAALLHNTYRRRLVQGVGWGPGHFQLITRVIQAIRVVMVQRPKQGFLLDELLDTIEADLAAADGFQGAA